MNPGLTPEPGQAAQEDTYPLGLSSDAGDRPCPRQKRVFTLSASLHKHMVSRSSGGLCYGHRGRVPDVQGLRGADRLAPAPAA